MKTLYIEDLPQAQPLQMPRGGYRGQPAPATAQPTQQPGDEPGFFSQLFSPMDRGAYEGQPAPASDMAGDLMAPLPRASTDAYLPETAPRPTSRPTDMQQEFDRKVGAGTSPLPAGQVKVKYIEDLQDEASAPEQGYGFGSMDPRTMAMDVVTTFNHSLASVAALPVAAIDNALKSVGLHIVETGDQFTTSGDAEKAILAAMEAQGVSADKRRVVHEFLGEMGSSLATSAIGGAALYSLAPRMMAAGGPLGTIGREMVMKPGTVAATEVGAAAGAAGGKRLAPEGYENVGEVAGAIAGGGFGPTIRNTAAALPSALKPSLGSVGSMGLVGAADAAIGTAPVGSILAAPVVIGARAIAKSRGVGKAALAKEAIPQSTRAIIQQGVEPGLAKQFAEETIAGDMLKIDNTIKATLKAIPANADPLMASEELRATVRKAYTKSQELAGKRWDKVDLTQKMSGTGIKNFFSQMVAATSRLAPDDIPPITDVINRIGVTNPKTGLVNNTITLKDLRGLRGTILARSRQPMTNDKLRKNYNDVIKQIDIEMEKAFPKDVRLQEAIAFTKRLHDAFDIGPVGKYLGREGGKKARVSGQLGDVQDPDRATTALLRRSKSGVALDEVARVSKMPEVIARSEQVVREHFTSIAAKMDAQGAQAGMKMLQKPEIQRFMKSLPALDAEMTGVQKVLGEALEQRSVIEKSAFKQFADEDLQTATNRLYNASNKVDAAREITNRLADHPDALASLRNHVIQDLVKEANGSPRHMRNRMDQHDVQEMLGAVLGNGGLSRLNRMVNDGLAIENGAAGKMRKIVRAPTVLASRILGVEATPGASLQTKAMVSSGIKQVLNRAFSQMDAPTLISLAVNDPHWERVLFARNPENLTQAKKAVRLMKRAVITLDASTRLPENEE